VLGAAASLEVRSEHPVGQAIVRRATSEGIGLDPVEHFQALPGRGAEAIVGGRPVFVGNSALLADRGVRSAELAAADDALASRGASPTFVVRDGVAIGAIGVADQPREAAREALDLLRSNGIERIAMLTGDNRRAAETLARSLGIDDVRADLLPEHKAEAVAALKAQCGTLAMVGDGVNDAPALATADVGIAMGVAGSAAALETADVALMADELAKISYAVRLSRATARNIRANIGFSLALKAAFLLLAIAGFATLWMAVAADMGASLLVIANALRLLRE
jgi:Zn2+/Cd2+-exporting ATPase